MPELSVCIYKFKKKIVKVDRSKSENRKKREMNLETGMTTTTPHIVLLVLNTVKSCSILAR